MRSQDKTNETKNLWTFRLWVLVLAHLFGTLNIVSVLAMAPVISRQLNLSAAEFGFLVTAYYGGQALCSVPSGVLVDRYGIGKSLIGSHLVMSSAAIILSFSSSFSLSLFSLFLMGIGYSMTNPASGRAVLIWFSPAVRGTAMGIKQLGVSLGGVLAAGNGALVTILAWQDIMLANGLLIFLNGIFCFYLLNQKDETNDIKKSSLTKIKQVISMPQLQVNTLLNCFINVGQINFFSFLTLFLREVVVVSQPMAGLAMGLAQTSSGVGRVFWGIVCDRWFVGRRSILMALICGGASVFLAAMILLETYNGPLCALLLAGLLGFTIASYAPIAQTITVEMVNPELAGSALGYNLLGVFIGGMIGPPVFGAIIDWSGSFSHAWLLTSFITALGTFILVRWFREGKVVE